MDTADPTDLSCRELVELVTDYFEGALDPAEHARFEAHVAECPGCESYLSQMRITLEVVRSTRAIEERPEVEALLLAFRDWKRA